MENIVNFRPNQRKSLKVSELLRLYRTRSNLTQYELARRLNLQSGRMVKKWENDQSLPEAGRLRKLIEVYLREGIFTSGQERHEAQNLWATVKLAFEMQSPTFEIYNIFDAGWFDDLSSEMALSSTAKNKEKLAEPLQQPAKFQPVSRSNPHNLPVRLTGLIGREKESRQIKQLLENTRCLTLTGPAGVGKTRLALQVAQNLVQNFKDGIWLVSLANVTSPELFIERLATVVNPTLSDEGETFERLIDWLRSKELFLVLDECDTTIPESGQTLNRLLKSCLHLKILATSRESLGIRGETNFKIGPLGLPGLGLENGDAGTSEAVQLFIERAETIQPGFTQTLTQQNEHRIGRICQQLDGLPLAIELAARLVEGFSLEQIESRMHNPFSLLKLRKLKGNSGDDHHLSLEVSLDWSYDRLNPTEQQMLKLMAELPEPAGFNLEEVEQQYREIGGDANQVLDLVYSLVKKSLVESNINELDDTSSFSLLQIIQKYIRNKTTKGINFE